ncbi:hypothetical protein Tco_0701730 [Tanacetum coccineum]
MSKCKGTKSISKRHGLFMNSIKDDAVLGRLKFVSKGEGNQVIVVPKKARKGMKTIVASKKKGSITADDNIIPDLEKALKLGKSISRTEAEEQEEARRVHETHERLVTKKPTSDEGSDESDEEHEDMLTRRRLTGLNEGAGITPEVPDEPKGKSKGSSEGAGIILEVLDELKGKSIAQDDDWGFDEEEVILSSDDERTESEKEIAENEKANEKTADEDEVHSDDEVHTEEEEQTDDEHYDEEVHDDKYVNDDVEKHDDMMRR